MTTKILIIKGNNLRYTSKRHLKKDDNGLKTLYRFLVFLHFVYFKNKGSIIGSRDIFKKPFFTY